MSKLVKLLYGKTGMTVNVPDDTAILEGQDPPALADAHHAVMDALASPIGSPSLEQMLARRKPATVAVTVSDITRPVPNKQFVPEILEVLNRCGVADGQIVIIIATGLHRPSTPQEREVLLGREITSRVEVIDHDAQDAASLVQVSDDPPISICRRFVEADFRIVTGFIEPHFMAGFSGGRKGVCPGLVDLGTLQRFHGYKTLSSPQAESGVLNGNPCHDIAAAIARKVGVDFLFNVALNRGRQIAGIYCGDLEKAHTEGCRQVAQWATAEVGDHFDLVITNGGGYPLDQTFYQSVKGMVAALPALAEHSTLLVVSQCAEKMGSPPYTELMKAYAGDWRRFLSDIAKTDQVTLDQWQFQMQARVLERIGQHRLWLVSDGLPLEMQHWAAVNPIICEGDCANRAQRVIDEWVAGNPGERLAVIPDGPYTMLRKTN